MLSSIRGMKAFLFFLVLLLFSINILAQQPAAPAPQKSRTNHIEFFLLETALPPEQTISGKIDIGSLKLKKEPILSDPDFVSWDLQKHAFVIKPEAAKRLVVQCFHRIVPFVLVCDGQRVYAGLFNTSVSSASAAMPVILTDTIIWHLFENSQDLPPSFWRQLGMSTETREAALKSIPNKTQNVRLQIDPGYPGLISGNPDIRPDKRIAAAVQKLFKRK